MISDTFWDINVGDFVNSLILIATIVAIVYGPVFALKRSELRSERRDENQRKRNILSALMRTRRMYMHADHIQALNIVQLEFSKSSDVMRCFKDYIRNLGDPIPQPGNDLNNFLERRSELFFDLLHQMGLDVGVNIDRADLSRLSYLPYGIAEEEQAVREVRALFKEVLLGQRPLLIAQFGQGPQSPPNPFPPPPRRIV